MTLNIMFTTVFIFKLIRLFILNQAIIIAYLKDTCHLMFVRPVFIGTLELLLPDTTILVCILLAFVNPIRFILELDRLSGQRINVRRCYLAVGISIIFIRFSGVVCRICFKIIKKSTRPHIFNAILDHLVFILNIFLTEIRIIVFDIIKEYMLSKSVHGITL